MNLSWNIDSLDYYKEFEGQNDVVYIIQWSRCAEQGDVKARVYGQQAIKYAENESFVPYENLTKETVISWLESALGQERIDQLDAALGLEMQNKIAPVVVTNSLPW